MPRMTLCSLLIALMLLSGCQVRLISDYDEYTDQTVSALQRQVETHLTRMEKTASGFDGNPIRPDCEYGTNRTFYIDALATTRALQARNEVRPKNALTTQQLGLLIDNIQLMETLHTGEPASEQNCLAAGEVPILRANMNQMFVAILKLEIAKKRGEEQ